MLLFRMKIKRRAKVLFVKAIMHKKKVIAVDKSVMKKRKQEAEIKNEIFAEYALLQIKEVLKEAKKQQIEVTEDIEKM